MTAFDSDFLPTFFSHPLYDILAIHDLIIHIIHTFANNKRSNYLVKLQYRGSQSFGEWRKCIHFIRKTAFIAGPVGAAIGVILTMVMQLIIN